MLIELGGKDATKDYEDVGHSDEASNILEGLFVGKLISDKTEMVSEFQFVLNAAFNIISSSLEIISCTKN